MKAVYWNDLKIEDKRWFLANKKPGYGISILWGFMIIGLMFIILTGTNAIATKKYVDSLGNQTLSKEIKEFPNSLDKKLDFLPILTIFIFLTDLILGIISETRYNKFYNNHFKYAKKSIKFSTWLKDKIDGEII